MKYRISVIFSNFKILNCPTLFLVINYTLMIVTYLRTINRSIDVLSQMKNYSEDSMS